MKLLCSVLGVLLIVGLLSSCSHRLEDNSEGSGSDKKKVLVFSKTVGFRHGSIESGQDALQQLGLENGFEVVLTEDAAMFTDVSLGQFSSVVFLNTTGDVLYPYQQIAFERFIQV